MQFDIHCPEVAGLLSLDIDARLRADGFEAVPATGSIMARAGRFDRAHRDPFDRIIAATALERRVAVVSKDATLDAVPGGGLVRVWQGRQVRRDSMPDGASSYPAASSTFGSLSQRSARDDLA